MSYNNTFAGIPGRPIQLEDINNQFNAVEAALDLVAAEAARTIRMPTGETASITAGENEVLMFDPDGTVKTGALRTSTTNWDVIQPAQNTRPYIQLIGGDAVGTGGLATVTMDDFFASESRETWTVYNDGATVRVPFAGIYYVHVSLNPLGAGIFTLPNNEQFFMALYRENLETNIKSNAVAKDGSGNVAGWPIMHGIINANTGDDFDIRVTYTDEIQMFDVRWVMVGLHT